MAEEKKFKIGMIYTSYFAFIRRLPVDMLKMSVSLFTPQWAKIDGFLPYFNPPEKLLREAKSGKISLDEAMKIYREEILGKLSPARVYEELLTILQKNGKRDLALLCYEKPGEICHRRIIAEWLESALQVSILEYIPNNIQLFLI
ncbi:MAG: DUF488 domain-containing protein [Rickettsiales bacterium]|nr:DUF488 domain-containing protein [Rickettsiales bacterium]